MHSVEIHPVSRALRSDLRMRTQSGSRKRSGRLVTLC
jgi:hypothetical protein